MTEADTVRYRIIVTGHVQGVWFRDSCRAEADRLSITGWVRNRPDGDVEVAAEGTADAVDRLIAWCRRGPTRARVDAVEVTPERPRGDGRFHVIG